MNFIIIINGSNDLYSPLKKGFLTLLKDIEKYKNIKIKIIYSLKKIENLGCWKVENFDFKKEAGVFIWDGKTLREEDFENYIEKLNIKQSTVELFNLELILNDFIEESLENIVIISGHGGLFQCFLDMSQSPAISLNTVKFCNSLKSKKIDFLLLDMCAMNYLEIFYQLFNNSKIKQLVTYKNLAPFEFLDYRKLLDLAYNGEKLKALPKAFIENQDYPFIYFSKENFNLLKDIKDIENAIAKRCLLDENPDFTETIDEFKDLIYKSCYENKEAKLFKAMPLNFLKFYLEDEIDRTIYKQFDISKNNKWSYLVSGSLKSKIDYEIIPLDKESIEHIIWLQNSKLRKAEVKIITEKWIKAREEQWFYK